MPLPVLLFGPSYLRFTHLSTDISLSSLSCGNPGKSTDLLVTHNWIPPPTGWIRVNCDAAVGDLVAGLGVVVRDCLGRPLLVAGRRMLSQAVDMMETQALLMVLDMIRDLLPLYRAVELQSDSMMAIQEVRKLMSLTPGSGVFAATIQYASGVEAVRFLHILRDGNKLADWAARAACSNDFV
ncbi:hypothetical protein HPP92_013306 [Vanilla planifolia]|uniref:RNase H type-1 domain-containing protein n=1 Tax=Vanilla planifolia TaxID=51239 RepID=A0A835R3A2_VANPL|nr:hypothetical protein HPP92_013306 [Vanilla planifolia]